jgi:hypothetical protein
VAEPRLERPRRAAGPVAEALDPREEVVVGDADVAQQEVAVPGQRLRVAAHGHVRAQLQRPLAERRGGGVVDRDQGARRPRGAGDGGDVADVELRVAGRLQDDEPDVVQSAPRGELADLRRGQVLHRDAEPLELLGGEQTGRVVAVRGQDDAVAGARAREHRGGDRGHPGREGQAATAVQLADGGLEVPQRGLLGAGVGVDAPGARWEVAQVERRREHRGGPQRSPGDGRLLPGPDGTGAVPPVHAGPLIPAWPLAT